MRQFALSLTLAVGAIASTIQPLRAEGSRTLYPSGATATDARANLQWLNTTTWYSPPSSPLSSRTFLKVYAKQNEIIYLGSSAIGVGTADIQVYNPNQVTGLIGQETIPTLTGVPTNGTYANGFSCNAQRTALIPNQGRITSRAQELAGPSPSPGGYVPCFYQVPNDGVYDVAFFGTDGPNGTNPLPAPTGEINLTSTANFDNNQSTHVAAWDVTVRSDLTSTTDINGRLFTYYAALFTGNNGRPVNSTIYIVTTDGFIYRTDLNRIDPNGFVLYGNRVGYLDGSTPINHDLVDGVNDLLSSPQGGITAPRPEFPIFFNDPRPSKNDTFPNINPPDSGVPGASRIANRIPADPTPPEVTNVSFSGTAGGNSSLFNTGGTFKYTANVPHTYEILISRDGTNFDPGNPQNRVLRGLNPLGNQSIIWDGKDNSGTAFPVNTSGNPYKTRVEIQSGTYHFPLLDIENNPGGGPQFTLLNPPPARGCPFGIPACTGAFYDDRNYRTSSNQLIDPTLQSNQPLRNAPVIPYSGSPGAFSPFDSSLPNRQFTNMFGDRKGLDIWTQYPSSPVNLNLNIVDTQPDLTIKKTHAGNFSVGKQGVYTLTVTNGLTSGLTTGSITVTDTLPAGLTFVSGTGTNWSCSTSGQTVTCTYNGSAIGPGGSPPDITLTVNVTSAAVGTVANTATVATPNDSNPNNNNSTDNTIVNIAPDARKSIRFLRDNDGTGTLTINDVIQYTLIVENPAVNPQPFTNLIIKETTPVQLQVLRDAANPIEIITTNNGANPVFTLDANFPSSSFNGDGNPLTFATGTLAPGGRVTIRFNARILPGSPSPISNQGSVNYDGDGGVPVLTDASDTTNPTSPGTGDANTAGKPDPVASGGNVKQLNNSNADVTVVNFISPTSPAGTKSVRLVVDADNSNSVTTGDTLEYTVTYINNDPTNLIASFLVKDSVDANNLSFVPGSYSFQKFDGTGVNGATTVTSNPNYNGTTDNNLTSSTTLGQLGAGGGKVVVKFRAVVKSPANTQVNNQASATSIAPVPIPSLKSPSFTDAIAAPGDIPQPLGGDSDQTVVNVGTPTLSPNLRLVKRVTNATRNNIPVSGFNFGNFISVDANNDKAPGWPTNFLLGVPTSTATSLQSGDDLEYTLYFLSDGGSPVNNAKFCDLIPTGTIFSPDSFGSGNGISLNRANISTPRTNAADTDEATFFTPLAPLPVPNACSNQTNPDGAVLVNLPSILNTPGNNYGFIRFRVKIK